MGRKITARSAMLRPAMPRSITLACARRVITRMAISMQARRTFSSAANKGHAGLSEPVCFRVGETKPKRSALFDRMGAGEFEKVGPYCSAVWMNAASGTTVTVHKFSFKGAETVGDEDAERGVGHVKRAEREVKPDAGDLPYVDYCPECVESSTHPAECPTQQRATGVGLPASMLGPAGSMNPSSTQMATTHPRMIL